MTKELLFTKPIQVKRTTDVLIVGGGVAGVSAAIAAAHKGVRVLLIESQTCLGGLGASGLVPVFQTFGDGIKFLAGGVGKFIYDRMKKDNIIRDDNTFYIEKLKILYEDLLSEFGVEFVYCTTLIDTIKEKDELKIAIVNSKSGIYAIEAKMFIDCTGDGDLSAMSGAEFQKGDKDGNMMAGTLCSVWHNVDFSRFDESQQEKNILQAYEDGVLSVKDRHLPGMYYGGETFAFGNIGHAFGIDGTDEISITKAFIEQRKILHEYEAYYNKYIDGFENAKLILTASMMGIRESRRIIGDYILNLQDFKNQSTFEDEVGRYCYPIDVHESSPSDDCHEKFKQEFYNSYRYKPGESYGIPYRSLIVKGFKNLLVAGRCISCDRYMLGSIRVMPGCYITGQAVGLAASIAVNQNTDTRGFDFSILKKEIDDLWELSNTHLG